MNLRVDGGNLLLEGGVDYFHCLSASKRDVMIQ